MNKNSKFKINGFLIKRLDSNYGKKYGNYLGIEGDIWPIFIDTKAIPSEEAEYLYNYIDKKVKKSFYEDDIIEVCNDINFLNRYIKVCNELKYKIEVLLCETEKLKPILHIEKEKLKKDFIFLGYDYGYPGEDYYSCVYTDVGRVPELKNISKNRYGLISTFDEIIHFVNLRNRLRPLLSKGTFEEGDDYVIYRIWKYNGRNPIEF